MPTPPSATPEEIARIIRDRIPSLVARSLEGGPGKLLPPGSKVADVRVTSGAVLIELSASTLNWPWRPDSISALKAAIVDMMPQPPQSPPQIIVSDRPLEDYIPKWYVAGRAPREGATSAPPHAVAPLRRNVSAASQPSNQSLAGRHIVVWASHGQLYDNKNRMLWQWQRPRMFTTVEDMFTMSFVNMYLIPMLENAGAIVFNCRERDFQVNEVVVDDGDVASRSSSSAGFRTTAARKGNSFVTTSTKGFGSGHTPYADGVNPHALGTTRMARTAAAASASAWWTPEIPEEGVYAVYVSYASLPASAPDAHYTVHHAGGATSFLINQQMAGNSWVYLGSFHFAAGSDSRSGSVELSNESATAGTVVSADAVKFGGGMGNIQRGGKVSGFPRYAEGARYWLQYCGVDPKLVWAFSSIAGEEYTEEYISRSEYGNYLVGAPRGPRADRNFPGLGVPLDLSFAMHTDAGITTGIAGTLLLYNSRGGDRQKQFPDGRDRLLCRDLADLIQTQIVDDLRAQYCSSWSRRALQDGNLAESRQPNFPAALLELLSHQNYDDMKFGLDPQFRFDVARAIYKGMLRFLATEYSFIPVVQPLPPDHLKVQTLGPDAIRVSWQVVRDPLEPSAQPAGYVVYCRQDNGGFDNGTRVDGEEKTYVDVPVANPGTILSFRVTAVNAGGESFPSETLSACIGEAGAPRAIIVSGFTRLAPPAMLPGRLEGAHRWIDRGVGDHWTCGLTGDQYDFDRSHPWLGNDTPFTNDNPGHGASYGDLEKKQELGNTFDYAVRHGRSLTACGWGFDSVSAQALAADPAAATMLARYKVVDWLLGEQRTTMPPEAHDGQHGAADKMKPRFQTWPRSHQKIVREYLGAGGRLFVSGAYVATDLMNSPLSATEDKAFLKDVLHCTYITDHGSRTNDIAPSPAAGPFEGMPVLHVSSGLGEDGVYGVELPGGIDGPDKKEGVLRYTDGDVGAAVASSTGTARRVILGFPFECITGEANRTELLSRVLSYLGETSATLAASRDAGRTGSKVDRQRGSSVKPEITKSQRELSVRRSRSRTGQR